MKKLFLLLMLVSGLCTLSFTSRWEEEVVYTPWTHIGESATHYEVEYRIVKCGGADQVHLFLFNESNAAQRANFTLEFTKNANGEKSSKDVLFDMEAFKMYKALCDGDNQTAALRLNLPEGFDPKNTSVKVTFK